MSITFKFIAKKKSQPQQIQEHPGKYRHRRKKKSRKCDFCWGTMNSGATPPALHPTPTQQRGSPAAAHPSSTFPMAAVGPRRRGRLSPATIACSGRRSGLGTRGAPLSHQPPKFSLAAQPRSQAARAVDAAADAVVCSSEINCATNAAQRRAALATAKQL